MSEVYVQTDANGRVVAINSGDFMTVTDGWTLIDEGEGDRYHHAQGNYLEGSLTTEQGVYRYKLVDSTLQGRTPEEIQSDIAALPPLPPTPVEVVFRTLAQAGTLTEKQALQHKTVFPLWAECIGQEAPAGAYYRHQDALYRVNEGKTHIIQETWPPDQAASLYSLSGDPGEEWPAWIQPSGAHNAYAIGAKVTRNDRRWVNELADNVYEPGVYGWREAT